MPVPRASSARRALLLGTLLTACSRPIPVSLPPGWQLPGDAGISAVPQNHFPLPVVASGGGSVYVAWVEATGSPTAATFGDRCLVVSRWDGATWSRLGDPFPLEPVSLTADQRQEAPWASMSPVGDDDGGSLVLAWSNLATTPASIEVRRWDPSKGWQQLPDPRVDPARRGGAASVVVDPLTRQPVVAWEEEESATDPRWRILVKRWDGTDWKAYQTGTDLKPTPLDSLVSDVGDPCQHDWAGPPTIAMDGQGNPVVAFTDVAVTKVTSTPGGTTCEHERHVAIRRWNPVTGAWGTTMEDLGAGRDARGDFRLGLVVSGTSVYAAACHGVSTPAADTYGPVRVVKGDGSAVLTPLIGPGLGAPDGRSCAPSLALDGRGRLLVAFDEPVDPSSTDPRFVARVRRLDPMDGTGTWTSLGEATDINTGAQYDAHMPTLAVDALGVPVVAWFEGAESGPMSQVKTWRWFVRRFAE